MAAEKAAHVEQKSQANVNSKLSEEQKSANKAVHAADNQRCRARIAEKVRASMT